VTGSDAALYPPMSTALQGWGIPVALGFSPENVLDDPADLVVIGNAVRPENPEARAAIDRGLSYRSFPDALFELAMRDKHPVVVTGTHGKTTTSGLVASLLHGTGRDPSFLVGGILEDFHSSFREGKGEHFVVEGDEYDTAFFDKTPKFLHYGARTAVLTSIEFDHADIYRDLDHVKSAFRSFVSALPPDGTLVAAADDPNVREVMRDAPCRVVRYVLESGESADWEARDLVPGPAGTRFGILRGGRPLAQAELPLHGRCNVANALAALVTLESLGVPIDDSVAALANYRGVKRRQEVAGEVSGITVIDDFAHHPTAVRETIAALRTAHPERRLVAVFEPRSNTSRRAVFQDAYAEALQAAHRVVVAPVPDRPVYSATGRVTEWLSVADLVAALRAQGCDAIALDGADAIAPWLVEECRPGDLVLVMSNGDFGGLVQKLLEGLRQRERSARDQR
jgi:UDP-N-acetylmuramate: L-alanyl-gamma-D-glutamyl-meso-diaminopimelate ligase